jgi:hypothetical protein
MGVGEKNPWLFLANTSEKCGTRDFPYSGWIQSKTHGFTSSVSNIKTRWHLTWESYILSHHAQVDFDHLII